MFDFTSIAILNWCCRCSAVNIEQILFFSTIHKGEFLLANSVITSAVNFPDFQNDLKHTPEKNSLRSDVLYAFFNKSLVFRSVISDWYLIRSLLFTLQVFSKTNMLLEWGWKIVDSWWKFILKQLDISDKFSYSHANLFSPEVSKCFCWKWSELCFTLTMCHIISSSFISKTVISEYTPDSFPLT